VLCWPLRIGRMNVYPLKNKKESPILPRRING
jgi:hypothetical protein